MFWLKINDKKTLIVFSIILTSFIAALIILLFQSGFASSVIKKFEFTFIDTPEEQSVPNTTKVPVKDETIVFGEEHKIYNKPNFIEAAPPEYLRHATTTNLPSSVKQNDLYIGEDAYNNLKLLHYKKPNYRATTTYPVYRIYPNDVSEAEIIADYRSEDDIDNIPLWFGKQPKQIEMVEDVLLTKNLVVNADGNPVLPDWLIIPRDCFTYIPGDSCRFEITAQNPYGFPITTLTKENSLFKWSGNSTPYAINVTKDKKILIRWSFGDAGISSEMNSLWDPMANTHIELSSIFERYDDTFRLELPQLEKRYVISLDAAIASTTTFLKQNPFQGWKIYNEALLPDCYNIHFYPTNLVDYSAPWLLEYEYGCYFSYNQESGVSRGLSSWYELNPVTDSIRTLTGVIPK